MSYNLFLDDERKVQAVTWVKLPLVPWTIVRNYKTFCDIIEKQGIPKVVTYDHDLGVYDGTTAENTALYNKIIHRSLQGYSIDYDAIPAKTGYHCAKFLVEKCMELGVSHPPYTVHSMNPIGAENIRSYIENYNNYWKINESLRKGIK